ncbi:hypothetical protein Sjap_023791 [Stephania japonica]|uniref:Methyltransferase type 11 domain-containing protein n=1 Tax=Stephania japonica TaxID=461633 RepID=A0AAP0HKV0_9MAGN
MCVSVPHLKMLLHFPPFHPPHSFFSTPDSVASPYKPLKHVNCVSNSLLPLSPPSSTPPDFSLESSPRKPQISEPPESIISNGGFCLCGRRHLIGACGLAFIPTLPSYASDDDALFNSKATKKNVDLPWSDWNDEFYAMMMEKSMKSYEAEVSNYKAALFAEVRGKNERVLELGIGTGPNLKYYGGGDAGVHVLGVDPNKAMEKYAQAAAVAAGIPLTNFNFMQAVGEALPVNDTSMDVVIGTLVLCTVKDVKTTIKEVKRVLKPGGLYIFIEHVAAKDGTVLRFVQNALDPLQQLVSNGCHLTRETGSYFSEAGFSGVDMQMASLSNAFIISPHIFGIARK